MSKIFERFFPVKKSASQGSVSSGSFENSAVTDSFILGSDNFKVFKDLYNHGHKFKQLQVSFDNCSENSDLANFFMPKEDIDLFALSPNDKAIVLKDINFESIDEVVIISPVNESWKFSALCNLIKKSKITSLTINSANFSNSNLDSIIFQKTQFEILLCALHDSTSITELSISNSSIISRDFQFTLSYNMLVQILRSLESKDFKFNVSNEMLDLLLKSLKSHAYKFTMSEDKDFQFTISYNILGRVFKSLESKDSKFAISDDTLDRILKPLKSKHFQFTISYDALAQILKSLAVKNLTFSVLSYDMLDKLWEALESKDSKLTISHDMLVQKLKSFKSKDSKFTITDDVSDKLWEALESNNSKFAISDDMLVQILKYLNNNKLKVLLLEKQSLNGACIKVIGEIVIKQTLTSVSITNSTMTNTQLEAISSVIAKNRSIVQLDFSGHMFSAKALEFLFIKLQEQERGIRLNKLNLSACGIELFINEQLRDLFSMANFAKEITINSQFNVEQIIIIDQFMGDLALHEPCIVRLGTTETREQYTDVRGEEAVVFIEEQRLNKYLSYPHKNKMLEMSFFTFELKIERNSNGLAVSQKIYLSTINEFSEALGTYQELKGDLKLREAKLTKSDSKEEKPVFNLLTRSDSKEYQGQVVKPGARIAIPPVKSAKLVVPPKPLSVLSRTNSESSWVSSTSTSKGERQPLLAKPKISNDDWRKELKAKIEKNNTSPILSKKSSPTFGKK